MALPLTLVINNNDDLETNASSLFRVTKCYYNNNDNSDVLLDDTSLITKLKNVTVLELKIVNDPDIIRNVINNQIPLLKNLQSFILSFATMSNKKYLETYYSNDSHNYVKCYQNITNVEVDVNKGLLFIELGNGIYLEDFYSLTKNSMFTTIIITKYHGKLFNNVDLNIFHDKVKHIVVLGTIDHNFEDLNINNFQYLETLWVCGGIDQEKIIMLPKVKNALIKNFNLDIFLRNQNKFNYVGMYYDSNFSFSNRLVEIRCHFILIVNCKCDPKSILPHSVLVCDSQQTEKILKEEILNI